MTTVSLLNRKGGCGVSTLMSNLAPALVQALREQHGPSARLLVVDAAPTCGATVLLTGTDPAKFDKTLATALAGQHRLADVAVNLDEEQDSLDPAIARARAGVSLVPNNTHATPRFADVDDLAALRDMLQAQPVRDVEMVLIDGGAAEGDLGEAALVAADHTVAVLTPGVLDAHGLNLLLRKARLMSRRFSHVRVGSVVLNRYDSRHGADRELAENLEAQLADRLCTPYVPQSAAIKRANNRYLPVTALAPVSQELVGTFDELARRILKDAAG